MEVDLELKFQAAVKKGEEALQHPTRNTLSPKDSEVYPSIEVGSIQGDSVVSVSQKSINKEKGKEDKEIWSRNSDYKVRRNLISNLFSYHDEEIETK